MEGKESMGLPSSGPTNMIPGPGGYGTMHQRNSEATPLPSPSIVHTPAPVRPEVTRSIAGPVVSQDGTRSIPGLVVTSLASSAPSYLNTPPMFTADMSTAIVPHFGGLNASGGVGFTGLSTMKKKRGRPRKYAPDGGIALSVTPLSSMPSSASPSQKRGRGRPPGSGKKQQLAALGELMAGSAGAGFTPHAIIVAAGEDVATRIMSFSQQGPRGICILSANGAISNVTLRQPSISGGTVTYEGRFEILSLSGSFLLTESGGTRSRTGGLSVSLAGPDGRVVGGGVAGMLIAASPVQVVVGSFIHNARKALPKVENVMGMPKTQITGNAALFSPTNEGDIKPDVPESSPLNQSTGATGSSESDSPHAQMIPPQTFSWPTPQVVQEARLNTDIDMSLPGG